MAGTVAALLGSRLREEETTPWTTLTRNMLAGSGDFGKKYLDP